jgi:hypothetical protein
MGNKSASRVEKVSTIIPCFAETPRLALTEIRFAAVVRSRLNRGTYSAAGKEDCQVILHNMQKGSHKAVSMTY